ncbi:hypothetical protein [Yeosuana marina]|uniref:hypothetical protein n=1 Tax=Yeosuana marina TaxID=1565536 RepID=UPI001F109327|nr:hypothetical protein [Yeosuana marina]
MSLFQYWNLGRFPKEFFINREEIMQLSKIGSYATYHRCLRALDAWTYIKYLPSHNPYKGSRVKMLIFDTTPEQVVNKHDTSSVQALVSNTNINKQIVNNNKTKLPKNEMEVISFFKNKKWPTNEAKKFFNHYQAIGWKIGGKIKIEDWQASANNWILKANEFETVSAVSQNKDNLRTSKNKDYGQPL